MRRSRRSRLDSTKLNKVATEVVAYIKDTNLIAPNIVEASINDITSYKRCWGAVERIRNDKGETVRDAFIDESATALVLAVVRRLQAQYR